MDVSGKNGPRLHLIRHGETEWTLLARHTGRTDLPLTAQGMEQARRLTPWVQKIAFAHVLSSPRQRARQTCELSGPDRAVEIDDDLAEWDYGSYEGLRSSEIEALKPGWSIFRDGCPDGETPTAISGRADRLIARLLLLEGNIALYSHGHFGRVLASRWIGEPIDFGRHLVLGTASLSILSRDGNHGGVAVLELWNAAPRTFASHNSAPGS